MWKNDPSAASSRGTNLLSLFSGAGVGASLSWFPLTGTGVLFLLQCQNPINQVCQVDDFRHSQIDRSTGHIWRRGGKGTGQPTESGHGIMGGKLGKVYIQVRGEPGQKFELYKKITHIEIELWSEATVERVREVISPLIKFSRYVARCQQAASSIKMAAVCGFFDARFQQSENVTLVITSNGDSHCRSSLALLLQDAVGEYQGAKQLQCCNFFWDSVNLLPFRTLFLVCPITWPSNWAH